MISSPAPARRTRSASAYGASLTSPPDRAQNSCGTQKNAHSRAVRSILTQQARLDQQLTVIVRRAARPRRLERRRLHIDRAMAGADLDQRLPRRGAHHTHKRRAARAARTRRGDEQRRALTRPGRRRRRGRDARDRCRACAHRGRQSAWRDRACCAHARAADARRRQRALPTPRATHDLERRQARAQVQRLAATRTRRRLRAGDLEHRQTAPRRRQEGRQPGARVAASTPRTRSSRSPPSPAARTAVSAQPAQR